MKRSFEELKQRKEALERAETDGNVWLLDVVDQLRDEWRAERGCPGDEDLTAYVEMQDHVDRCDLCRDDQQELKEALDSVRQLPTTEPRPMAAWRSWIARVFEGASTPAWRAVALVEALAIMGFVAYGYGLGTGRQQALHGQTFRAIKEEMKGAARFALEVNRARNDQDLIRAISRVSVTPAVTPHGQEYLFPAFDGLSASPAILSEGLSEIPALESDYLDYLEQWAEILLGVGDLLAMKGRLQDAILVFERLSAARSNDKSLLFVRGELYKMIGDHGRAVGIYEDMIARGLDTEDPRPWHFAAWSYYELGKAARTAAEDTLAEQHYQKAEEYYRRALEIFPGYPKVYLNLAQLFFTHPRLSPQRRQGLYQENFDRALELTLEAHAREGDINARITFTLAILEARRQQPARSLDYLERTFQQDSTYVLRAESESAFAVLRDPSHPQHGAFVELLAHHRVASRRFNMQLESHFDRTVFSE